jgi:carbon starvation protein CstA
VTVGDSDFDSRSDAVPQTVKAAAALVSTEAAALLAGALVLIVMAAVRTTTRLWAAFTIVGFALIAAAVLALCVRGLLALRPSARSPVIMVQLLALPVGYSLGFQSGRFAVAAPILIVAVAVLVLLLTPSARSALDRTV